MYTIFFLLQLIYHVFCIQNLKFNPALVTKNSILRDHDKIFDDYPKPAETKTTVQLAYVTPWNRRGYSLSVQTAQKLTHISPVWFQAKPYFENDKLKSCKIEGTQDINRDWITQIRIKNAKIQLVPRIIFEEWSASDMEQLLIKVNVGKRCFNAISDFYKRNEFDGAVVELYMQGIISMQSLKAKDLLIESIQDFSKVMKNLDLTIIFTVPAPLDSNNQPNFLLTPSEYKRILESTDFVQIMTYDYRGTKPTGVAPYHWIEKCLTYLQSSGTNTLVGLNFYGYQFSNRAVDAIVAERYLKLIEEESSTLSFDETAMEHKMKYDSTIVYFPSLTSIELRINLAHSFKAGIAIWDYGQGLDYFTNLL